MDKNRKLLAILFVGNLILHLLLLGWFTADYTDSIFLMDPRYIGKTKGLPLYPLLLQLFDFVIDDPEFAGRLISSLAASLIVFPLFFIADRVSGRKAGLYSVILFSCSAIALRWSLHVMTEATFALFFLLSIWNIVRFIPDMNKNHLRLATITAALAALTRPEGMAMLPVLALLYIWQFHRKGAGDFSKTIWSALAWVPLPIWHIATALPNNYLMEFSAGANELNLSKFALFFITYLKAFPYVLGYPVAIMAVLGGWFLIRERKPGFPAICIIFFLIWLAMLSIHWAWCTRLFYPLVPLALILAAAGIVIVELRFSKLAGRVLFGVCVLYSLIFLGAVFHFQRDAFGDHKRSSLFIKEKLSDKRVFTDELNKTGFWAGRNLLELDGKAFKRGDYVVFHSFYTRDIKRALNVLNTRFKLNYVFRDESRLVPLLADELIMKTPTGSPVNTPGAYALRFTPQRFESVIVELR